MRDEKLEIIKRLHRIAKHSFPGEKVTLFKPLNSTKYHYDIYKKGKEIANTFGVNLDDYRICIVIPRFEDNTAFIRAVKLALPDVVVWSVPWTQ